MFMGIPVLAIAIGFAFFALCMVLIEVSDWR